MIHDCIHTKNYNNVVSVYGRSLDLIIATIKVSNFYNKDGMLLSQQLKIVTVILACFCVKNIIRGRRERNQSPKLYKSPLSNWKHNLLIQHTSILPWNLRAMGNIACYWEFLIFEQVLKIATVEKIIDTLDESSLIPAWSYYGHLWFQAGHNLIIYDTQAEHSKVKSEII